MADILFIQSVTEAQGMRGIEYQVVIELPDGNRMLSTFNDEVLEWRAAEYGLDPVTDFETILDIVLHEPHLPDPTFPANFEKDEARKSGMVSRATKTWGGIIEIGDEVPTHLYNAPSIEEALEAHLIRIAALKRDRLEIRSSGVSTLAGKGISTDPLDLIRNNREIDPAEVALKRAHIEKTRATLLENVNQTARRGVNRITSRVIRRPLERKSSPRPYDESVEIRNGNLE